MAKLLYSMIMSLDGYVEDGHGKFDWAEPDEAVHAFVNDLERPVGTCLYGRRMYETMQAWETDRSLGRLSAVTQDYARIWKAAEKIVYSGTLAEVFTKKTRIEREFDPEAVLRLKTEKDTNITVAGPELAAHAVRSGIVDEFHFFVAPVVVGAGKPALPPDVRVPLQLMGERRFESGMVYLHYRIRS